MQVSVDMDDPSKFRVASWCAKSPEFVITALRSQLEAAQAVWPELTQYTVVERKNRIRSDSARGQAGGIARAAALSAERRSEIASDAAKARWGTGALRE